MIPALLLAASLAAQDAPAAAPATPPAAAEPAAASAAPALTGAPADDYGFVAWCRGALSGHMEVGASALPEIGRVQAEKARRLLEGKSGADAEKIRVSLDKDAAREAELDTEQQKAGRDYIALYQSALDAAEAAGADHARGEEATGQGYRIWSAARAAAPQTQMYSYLMWELPGRCETAARSLKSNSGLLGAAFKRAEVPAAPADTAPTPPASAPDAPGTDAAPPATVAPAPAPSLRPSAPAPGA